MDAKITKLRLSRMLSYDWFKIVLAAAGLIVVWLLIFTMTGTAITPSQKFTVMNYVGNVTFSEEFNKKYNSALFNDTFSYEVIETSIVDLAANESMAFELLLARTTVEEGDVIFVSDEHELVATNNFVETSNGTSYVYEKGDNYLDQFVSNNRGSLFDINVYLTNLETFLNRYYGDYKTVEEPDEQQIRLDFNFRTKKDKRFRKATARELGVQGEIARIKKYREALIKFNWYRAEKIVDVTETVVEDFYANGQEFRGTYAINLCPSLDKGGRKDVYDATKPAMHKLKAAVAYYPVVEDSEIGFKREMTLDAQTAENMNVCLFDFKGVADTFEYESLCYIVYMIDEYSSVKYETNNA